MYYYIVDSPRNEGKDFFEISMQTGEIFTKVVFDREKQGAYALEVEARDGAPSARPNSDNQPNSGRNLTRITLEFTKLLCKLRRIRRTWDIDNTFPITTETLHQHSNCNETLLLSVSINLRVRYVGQRLPSKKLCLKSYFWSYIKLWILCLIKPIE